MDCYTMSENEVHSEFSHWLNDRLIPFVHSRTDKRSRTKRGDPDFLIAWEGRCLFIEIKVDKNKLSDVQELRVKYLRNAGNPVLVCRSVEECQAACDSILFGKRATEHRNPRTGHLDAVGEQDKCKTKGMTVCAKVLRVSDGEE